jgi:hypothetical protein
MAEKPDNRLARELEGREISQRKQQWAPPQMLPDPKPQPGVTFRWIRVSTNGQFDATNASAKFREGWVPCKTEDHPEMQLFQDPTSNSRFKDNIEVGGLLLCRNSETAMQQRSEWYTRQAQSQMDAVDNSFMKTNDPRMPLFNERKSATSFGRGIK